MASLSIVHVGDTKRPTRTINLSRPATLADAIAHKGIDERHQVSLLRRRARYAQQQDRPKVWPGGTTIHLYTWHRNPDQASRDLAELNRTEDTARYVSLWCHLNHLKEA